MHKTIAAGMAEGPFEIKATAIPVPAEALKLAISGQQLIAPIVRFGVGWC
jgi:hypothetical protein